MRGWVRILGEHVGLLRPADEKFDLAHVEAIVRDRINGYASFLDVYPAR